MSVFAFVFVVSATAPSGVIKKTYGLRVTEEEEDAGLDISEHGMYGYPEQFIPAPELVGYGAAPARGAATAAGTRSTDHDRRCRHEEVEAYIRHEAFEPIRMELLDARASPR